MTPADLTHLKTIEQRLLWLSHWMIHHANHIRPKVDGIKIGGHQASSASMVSILTALYFSALRPEDRVAVKPHASPVFHAIQYLMGNQTREKMENFRGFGGVQSYPSRTKDIDDVDFSTGSVGLGVAITSFASIVQDFIAAKRGAGAFPLAAWWRWSAMPNWTRAMSTKPCRRAGRTTCAIAGGSSTTTASRLTASCAKGCLPGSRRSSTPSAGMWCGSNTARCSARPLPNRAASALRDWIDRCPNQEYAALTFMGGAVWRKRLMEDLGDQGEVSALIDRRSDIDLAALMENLGGNCVQTMAEAFAAITMTGRPAFWPIRSRAGAPRLPGTRTTTAV
jgi:pyruvate dehydrogenase E1 component